MNSTASKTNACTIGNLFLFFQDLEAKLETYASKIFMARAVLESIIPAFISVLIGPWSDKFGRRPILLSTFCGERSFFDFLCFRFHFAMRFYG